MSRIRKAARKHRPLKIGIGGITGSGKTLGALRLAYGICGDWEKICVLDTENASADLYAHLGGFSVIEPCDNSPQAYVGCIKEVVEAGIFEVLVIDSLTHEWAGKGGLLEQVERMQETGGNRQNSFAVWGKATPIHNAFIDSWLGLKMHVIGTMRKKDEYVIEANDRGKSAPKKVGLKNIQRDGLDYEFDVLLDVHANHFCTVSKDRTMIFDGQPAFMLDEDVGKALAGWSQTGDPEPDSPPLVEVTSAPVPGPVVTRCPPSPQAKIFEGTAEQISTLAAFMRRNGVADELHDEVFARMQGQPSTEVLSIIASVQSAARQPAETISDLGPV